FVTFCNISASGGGEEHQVIVRRGSKEMLDEIAFFFFGGAFPRLHADDPFAAAPLRAKCAYSRALDKAAMSDADDATLIADKIFDIDFALFRTEFRHARGPVLVADFA